MVREFHETFDLTTTSGPGRYFLPDTVGRQDRELRRDLLREEFQEYLLAESHNNAVEVLDALADMVYVIYGTALTYGLDLDAAIAEVHASNMSKLDEHGAVIKDKNGKVMKSALWEPPYLAGIVRDGLW